MTATPRRIGARLRTAARLAACVLVATGALSPARPVAAAVSAATYRILPLGDSITRGVGELGAGGEYVGWRRRLQQHLDSGAVPAGFRYDFVGSQSDPGATDGDHEGHGGWTIDQIAARADEWMAAYRPDVVLLHLGTNNVSRGESGAVIAAKLGALIARLRADQPLARIFVAKIIGTNGDLPGERARNAAYAAAIPGVVAAAGPRVFLVDQSSVRGADLYDHHHPNARGYSKMAFNWYRALRAELGSRWRPVVDPYLMRTAYVCQYDYDQRRRVCAQRAVA